MGSAIELILLAVIDGDREVERGLHQRFSHLNIIGEWFRPGNSLMDFIEGTSSWEVLYEMRQAGISDRRIRGHDL